MDIMLSKRPMCKGKQLNSSRRYCSVAFLYLKIWVTTEMKSFNGLLF